VKDGNTIVFIQRNPDFTFLREQMIDEGDCVAIGGMKFGRGNSEKTCPSAT
jgi:hypothetical protein